MLAKRERGDFACVYNMKSIKGIAISPSAPATKDPFEKQEERGVVQHGESGVKGAKGTNLWTGTKKSWRMGAMTEEIPRNGASFFFFFNTSYQGAGNPSVVQERE